MKQTMAFVTVGVLVLGAGSAFGHEDFRVTGTVTKYEHSALDVKSREGKTTSVRLDRWTVVIRDGEQVDDIELTVGLSVVVDAYGDTEDDLLALDIRIVPPIGAR